MSFPFRMYELAVQIFPEPFIFLVNFALFRSVVNIKLK